MWVRKKPEQIRKDHSRHWMSFRGPIIWFVVIFIMQLASIISPRNAGGWLPHDWYAFLFRAICIAGAGAIVVYIIQIILKEHIGLLKKGKVVICDNCYRVKNIDAVETCECGGKFDDFDNWLWIDDTLTGEEQNVQISGSKIGSK